MFNNNGKNYFIGYVSTSGAIEQKYKKIDGTENSGALYTSSGMWSPKTSKIDSISSAGSTFVLGSGTTPAAKTDYFVETQIDNTANFSITSASLINAKNQGQDAFAVIQQIWSYTNTESPTTEVTINEIGLCLNHTTYGKIMVAREVLESPIKVKDGDSFIVAMKIGI